jgi:AhpD family alkylhydroperoxidase
MSRFPDLTTETAPAASQKLIAATEHHLGYLPAAVARLATSPQLLDGFLKLTGIFDSTTLDPVAREVVVMAIVTRNGCHICIAMHTARLTQLGADPEVIKAARAAGQPLPDAKLETIRLFTLRAMDTTGDVGDDALTDFLDAGYTKQNALEVVLGIGTYTMSTLANRLTGAPVDPQLAAFA